MVGLGLRREGGRTPVFPRDASVLITTCLFACGCDCACGMSKNNVRLHLGRRAGGVSGANITEADTCVCNCDAAAN
jgi:hypothetical protein